MIFENLPIEKSPSISTDEVVKHGKLLLSNVIHNYLQTMSQVQASTQIIKEENVTKPYTSFCSTSTNT